VHPAPIVPSVVRVVGVHVIVAEAVPEGSSKVPLTAIDPSMSCVAPWTGAIHVPTVMGVAGTAIRMPWFATMGIFPVSKGVAAALTLGSLGLLESISSFVTVRVAEVAPKLKARLETDAGRSIDAWKFSSTTPELLFDSCPAKTNVAVSVWPTAGKKQL
jgi:hypothetical protein